MKRGLDESGGGGKLAGTAQHPLHRLLDSEVALKDRGGAGSCLPGSAL